MDKDELPSHTDYLESIMLTSLIYANEYRYIVTINIPNFFIQTPIDREPGEEKFISKIKVVLVNMLVQMDYGTRVSYVFHEKKK